MGPGFQPAAALLRGDVAGQKASGSPKATGQSSSSGSTSGDGKRGGLPRSVPAPILDSTACLPTAWKSSSDDWDRQATRSPTPLRPTCAAPRPSRGLREPGSGSGLEPHQAMVLEGMKQPQSDAGANCRPVLVVSICAGSEPRRQFGCIIAGSLGENGIPGMNCPGESKKWKSLLED